jgi:hypothetical protein
LVFFGLYVSYVADEVSTSFGKGRIKQQIGIDYVISFYIRYSIFIQG